MGKGPVTAPPLVFIGMPSSGKTTIGAEAARQLGLPFLDMDVALEQREGMTVQQIFARRGERYFRTLEGELAREYSSLKGVVIATGGGLVESHDAMALLAQSASVCRLRRDLSLVDTTGRPLLQRPGALEEIAARREPLYCKYADFVVDNNDTPAAVAARAVEIYLKGLEI